MKITLCLISILLFATACASGQAAMPSAESNAATEPAVGSAPQTEAPLPSPTLPAPTPTEEPTATQPPPPPTPTEKPTKAPPTATPSPDPAVLDSLKGVYTTTMTEEDWLSIVAGSGSDSFVREIVCRNGGQYTLTLGDGTFEFVQTLLPGCQAQASLRPVWKLEQGKFTSKGKWIVAGELFLITANDFHDGCSNKGEYLWKLTDNRLEFEYEDDTCVERNILMLTHPWTKTR